jgi:S1-C subfamily serine protease
MAVNKTAFIVGALGGASVAVAAMAGAGVKLPLLTLPHGGNLIQASTAPVFAPPPGAPESFADIFERVSPAVVSIHVTSKVDIQALKRSIPGFRKAAATATTIARRRSRKAQAPASSSRRTATSSPTITLSTALTTSRW